VVEQAEVALSDVEPAAWLLEYPFEASGAVAGGRGRAAVIATLVAPKTKPRASAPWTGWSGSGVRLGSTKKGQKKGGGPGGGGRRGETSGGGGGGGFTQIQRDQKALWQ